MRKTTAAALVTAAAAATAVGFSASPAFAATWTVSGSSGSGGAYTATAGTTTLRDTTSGTTLTCTSSHAAGNIPNGTGLSGTNIGSITSATFTSCSGPLGLTFTVTGTFPWHLNAITYHSATGVTDGTVTGVSAHLSGPGCSANVTGGTPGTYTNSTAKLALSPSAPNTTGVSLTISGVSGCFGLIGNGHTATFTSTYSVSPSTIHITSP
jgi:hypothetical protein